MKYVTSLLFGLLSLSIPVLLVLFSVGILLTPLYIQIEYRLPGFPEDPYGFTREERLYWANITRKYLIDNQGIDSLASLEMGGSPLYNSRELRHLYDVKVVIRSAAIFLGGVIFYMGVLAYWSNKSGYSRRFKSALSRGGWLTIGLIISIMVYLVFNFDSLFTNFHRIFFEGDTWLFRYSDTLIRLFPIQFWRDAFIWIGIMTFAAGFGIGYFVKER